MKIKYSFKNFPDSMRNFGFLSAQAFHSRANANSKDDGTYLIAKDLARQALAQGRRVKNTRLQGRHMQGLAHWIEAIDVLQGAMILANQGLNRASLASCRTGLECLMHASGYWASDEIAKKIRASDDVELKRMMRTMQKRFPAMVPAEMHITNPSKEQIKEENKVGVNTSLLAELTGMEELYFGMHKQLSFTGTHPNTAVAHQLISTDGEDMKIIMSQEIKFYKPAFLSVTSCLAKCIEEFNKHIEPFILNSSEVQKKTD